MKRLTALLLLAISHSALALPTCDPTKPTTATEEQEKHLLSLIAQTKAADENLAKIFQENPKLTPFNDYYDEYGKNVIIPSDNIAKMVAQGYNKAILKAYFSFESQFIRNFEHYAKIAIQRRSGDEAALNNMAIGLNLKSQHYHQLYDCYLK